MEHDRIHTGIYRHYKGGVYEVQSVAKHSETLEPLVIYRSMSDPEAIWARPVHMWNETITVDGESQPRFAFITGDEANMDSLPLFTVIEDVAQAMQTRTDEMYAYFHLPDGEVIYIHADGMRNAEDIETVDASALSDWMREEMNKALHFFEHEDEYLSVPPADSSDEYQMMESFISEIPLIPRMRERLEEAIQGKGAFRRFKDTLIKLRLDERWYAFRDAAYRRMAREWCDANDIAWGKKLVMKDGRNS